METFFCDCCKETYEKTRSDEEAMAESKRYFPIEDTYEMAYVCEFCFEKIMDTRGLGLA